MKKTLAAAFIAMLLVLAGPAAAKTETIASIKDETATNESFPQHRVRDAEALHHLQPARA